MNYFKNFVFILCVVVAANSVNAQTTSFTYQGSLNNGATPANGNYDIEFALFDAVSGGTQIGSNVTVTSVPVINGVFMANLNFGSQFPGANRFLEIRVRQTGGGAFTLLSPRSPINSSPYAVTALNATSLGGVAANQYVTTTGGGANFVQNTTVQQAGSNFNISGNGTANIINAVTQYNLGGGRILASPGTNATNLFIGNNAGSSNPTGPNNTMIGTSAGQNTSTGRNNTFVGSAAGAATSTGQNNVFFGAFAGNQNNIGSGNVFLGNEAGKANTTGYGNVFVGDSVGIANTVGFGNIFVGGGFANTTGSSNVFVGENSGGTNTIGQFNTFLGKSSGMANSEGASNVFVGNLAGSANSIGNLNVFVGRSAGGSNSTGTTNAFLGTNAGSGNTTGSGNTIIGNGANVDFGNLANASAFGARAAVSQSNSLVLGSINGINGATSDTNVGIGTTAPTYKLDVVGRIRLRQNAGELGPNNSAGIWLFQNNQDPERAFIGMENDNSVGFYGNHGGGWGLVMNILTGRTSIAQLGAAGSTPLCRNVSNEISTCSSSLRYKSNVDNFNPGLSLIKKLRPVSFNWSNGGMADMGLVAEEVNAVEPLLTTTNDKGEVEGVKYDRVGVVLVNAVNEQQQMIESLEKRAGEQSEIVKLQAANLKKQKEEIELLKKMICTIGPNLEFCSTPN